MSIELITLEEAKAHLRVVQDDEDADILLKIRAASQAVVNYLKTGADVFLDSDGNVIGETSDGSLIPDEVRLATLYLIGVFYKDRDGESMTEWELGYLPKPVISLLFPLRDPTCF